MPFEIAIVLKWHMIFMLYY